jgi:hypothetical protein
MQMARDARRARSQAASRAAIALADELAAGDGPAEDIRADPMWTVRGEQRTRLAFGNAHPADFPGGLPLPAE